MAATPDRVTIAEAAAITGASRRVLRQAIREGLLENVNAGGHPRVLLDEARKALRCIEARAAEARRNRAATAARARWRHARWWSD